MAKQYIRQNGIINIEEFRDNDIAIIGCGAIGSFTAISLAKMGLTNFTLWDFDKVEIHNLPNQFFYHGDINSYKVDATASHMLEFNNDVKIEKHLTEFDKNLKLKEKIVISCVDKMDARKTVFEACKKSKSVQLFIDARMGGLQGQVYFIDMADKKEIKNYEKGLFDNDEAVQLRCTERSIIFTVLGITSLICNQIVKAFKGEEIGNYVVIDYSVPQIM